MRTLIQHTILATLATVLLGSPVRATDYYVDGLHGNDATNDGLTVATAKETIQAAVLLATSP